MTPTTLALISTALGLVAAMPAPHHTENHIEVAVPAASFRDSHRLLLSPRQQQCQVERCTEMVTQCVKTCDSLRNADCFDVITSPICEGCEFTLVGCPEPAPA